MNKISRFSLERRFRILTFSSSVRWFMVVYNTSIACVSSKRTLESSDVWSSSTTVLSDMKTLFACTLSSTFVELLPITGTARVGRSGAFSIWNKKRERERERVKKGHSFGLPSRALFNRAFRRKTNITSA